MDWWLVTFFMGAIFSLLLPVVPAFFYVILFLLCFTLAYTNQFTRRYSAFFLGCAWLLFVASSYQNIWQVNKLDQILVSNQMITVTGKINTIPNCQDSRCRFNFIAQQLNNKSLTEPINIRLSWDTPNLALKQGQLWQLFVKIKPAHGLANAGGFSYQTWLRRHNIHATGYVRHKQPHRLFNKEVSHRQQLFVDFNEVLPSHALTPIIQALTFGERGGLNKSHWQILQKTQIQHLIAISGLHIGIVGGFSYFFVLLAIRILPLQTLLSTIPFIRKTAANVINICLNSNARIFALLFSAFCAGYYAYLAGFSVPTLRALVMIYWFLIFRLLAVKLAVQSWLSLSLFCIVLLLPMSLISMSFWLSIYAVFCIFIILWRLNKVFYHQNETDDSLVKRFRRKTVQLLLLQTMLTLLMLPLATLLSGQISLVAILANIVAVPLVSIIILPLAICALLITIFSTALAELIVNFVLLILSWLWQYLTFLSELPWAVFNLSQVQWVLLSIAVIFAFLSFIVIPNTRRWLVIPLVLALANIGAVTVPSSNLWQVKVMDVGQGLAVIVQKNHHVLLYDTGASYPSGFSMAESVLLPYLQHQGIGQLDWLIMSHDDNDHAGGFKLLNEKLTIDNLMTNDKQINAHYRCLAGDKYYWQQLTIEILSPNQVKGDDNDDSCVVRISDQRHSVLLTGDISQKIEKRLVNKAKSDILIAPHHGSKTSSSHIFLKSVSPQYAIFSTGFLNHWHMPAKTVVERYQKLNITTFNTAETGMVTFDITGNDIDVSRYRFDDWSYWFAN